MAEIELLDNPYYEPCEVLFRQVLLHRRRQPVRRVSGDSVSRYQGWDEGNPDLFKADRSGQRSAGNGPDIDMGLSGEPDLQL